MYEERKQQLLKSIEREKAELEITRKWRTLAFDGSLLIIAAESSLEKITASMYIEDPGTPARIPSFLECPGVLVR